MIGWLVLVGVLAVLLAAFALLPLRRGGSGAAIRVKTKKDELSDELNTLYTQIRELETQHQNNDLDTEDYQRFRLRDETRAAKVLQTIEATPDETPTAAPSANLRSGVLLFAATVLVLGGLSALAVPSLERLALRQGEAELYDNQNKLLTLAADLNTLAKAEAVKPEKDRQPLPISLLMKYGDVAWELSRYDDAAKGYGSALRQFTDAAKQNPQLQPTADNIKALSRYGQTLFFSGQADQALTLLRTAAKFNDAEAWLTIGNILFSSKNDPKGAIAAWQTFQKVNKDKAFGARVPDLIAAAKNRLRATDLGATVFATSCASCHGAEAQGLVGPNLKTSSQARSSAFIKNQLQNGSVNQKMPAFKTIQGKELEALIKFVVGLK